MDVNNCIWPDRKCPVMNVSKNDFSGIKDERNFLMCLWCMCVDYEGLCCSGVLIKRSLKTINEKWSKQCDICIKQFDKELFIRKALEKNKKSFVLDNNVVTFIVGPIEEKRHNCIRKFNDILNPLSRLDSDLVAKLKVKLQRKFNQLLKNNRFDKIEIFFIDARKEVDECLKKDLKNCAKNNIVRLDKELSGLNGKISGEKFRIYNKAKECLMSAKTSYRNREYQRAKDKAVEGIEMIEKLSQKGNSKNKTNASDEEKRRLEEKFPSTSLFPRRPGIDDREYILTGGEPPSGQKDRRITPIEKWSGILTYWEFHYGIIRLRKSMKGLFPDSNISWRKVFRFHLKFPSDNLPETVVDIGVFNNVYSYIGNLNYNLRSFTSSLIAGAKIYIKKCPGDDLEIGCIRTLAKKTVRILEFNTDGKLSVVEKEINFEVDEDWVLCESRYSNLVGLELIDNKNRETAKMVLEKIFRRIGEKFNGGYRAHINKILPAVSIYKPYNKAYLESLLQGQEFPCFYKDKDRDGWYWYNPQLKSIRKISHKKYLKNVANNLKDILNRKETIVRGTNKKIMEVKSSINQFEDSIKKTKKETELPENEIARISQEMERKELNKIYRKEKSYWLGYIIEFLLTGLKNMLKLLKRKDEKG